MSRPYEGVALLAPTTVAYQRRSHHGAAWFFGRALASMLAQTGLAKPDIDGLAVASFTLRPDSAPSLLEEFGLEVRWLEQLCLGGASAVVALRRAARAIQAGDAEIVACIGAETARRGSFEALVAQFSRYSREAVYPYGAGGPNTVFALITRAYMERYGAHREDFGRLCIAQRQNAAANPNALLREPLTLQQYLAARPIAEPLHLYDCVMPCAGAEGFLVTSLERAGRTGAPHAVVLGAEERHNAWFDDALQLRGGWDLFRDPLYAAAQYGPGDMDFVQTYDDYPVIVLLQLEDLGFCPKGEAAAFLRSTDLSCAGRGLPHNTCGGQLSCGQAGAAGGFLGLVEGLRQLTGQPLGRPVPDAQLGLVSGYGMANYDRGLCTAAAVLARGEP